MPRSIQPGELTGPAFSELWCVDIWDLSADLAGKLAGINLDPIRTPADQHAEAMRAGKALERLTYKYTWLAWMRSPTLEMSQDMLCLAVFFGGKCLAVSKVVSGKSGKPGSDLPKEPIETKDFSK